MFVTKRNGQTEQLFYDKMHLTSRNADGFSRKSNEVTQQTLKLTKILKNKAFNTVFKKMK